MAARSVESKCELTSNGYRISLKNASIILKRPNANLVIIMMLLFLINSLLLDIFFTYYVKLLHFPEGTNNRKYVQYLTMQHV